MTSNKEREQIQKTQEYLRQKNSHRKTLPKHKFIILNYRPVQPEEQYDSFNETSDSEEDLEDLVDTSDVYQRSSDIELEASNEEVDETSEEELNKASDEEMDEVD